jgi:hypothetical protein
VGARSVAIRWFQSDFVLVNCFLIFCLVADQRFPDEHEKAAPDAGAASPSEIALLAKKRCVRDSLRSFFTDNPTWK